MEATLVRHHGVGRGRVITSVKKPNDVNSAKANRFNHIEGLMNLLTLSSVEDKTNNQVQLLIQAIEHACTSIDNIKFVANTIFTFCLKDKESAKMGAIISRHVCDLGMHGRQIRGLLLQEIQYDFECRESIFLNKQRFIQSVVICFEIFQNIRLPNGDCLISLTSSLIAYLNMLLRSLSELEIETFVEQTLNCYQDLKKHQPDAFQKILYKIRAQIVTAPSALIRWKLLWLLERIQTGACLKPEVEEFYKISIQNSKLHKRL